jgi:hypothetical protein
MHFKIWGDNLMDYTVDWIIINKTDGTKIDLSQPPVSKPLPNTVSLMSSAVSEILIKDDKIKVIIASSPKVKGVITGIPFKKDISYQIFPKSEIASILIPVVTSLSGDKVNWVEFSNGTKFQTNFGDVEGIMVNEEEIVVSLSGSQYTPTPKKNLIPYMAVYYISQNSDFFYHV